MTRLIKLLTGAATAAILLFVFFMESPAPARGPSAGRNEQQSGGMH